MEREPKETQPFFPLFEVLDQSGCRVEIIFVTTNNLLIKQAQKKLKKIKSKYPFFPCFKSRTNQVAGWRIFVTTNSLPTQAKKKKKKH